MNTFEIAFSNSPMAMKAFLRSVKDNEVIIQAYHEGKTVQFMGSSEQWEDYNQEEKKHRTFGDKGYYFAPWYYADFCKWRIKPTVRTEKRKGWINVYSNGADVIHHTKELADESAGKYRLACVEVEYEFQVEEY